MSPLMHLTPPLLAKRLMAGLVMPWMWELPCGIWNQAFSSQNFNLVEWAWELYTEGTLLEALDPKLEKAYDVARWRRCWNWGCCAPRVYKFKMRIWMGIDTWRLLLNSKFKRAGCIGHQLASLSIHIITYARYTVWAWHIWMTDGRCRVYVDGT